MMVKLFCFHACARIERMHPLEGGLFRLKFRRDRRSHMPLEAPAVFYSRYLWDIVRKYCQALALVSRYLYVLFRVEIGIPASGHKDIAMRPVGQINVEAKSLSHIPKVPAVVVAEKAAVPVQ